MFSRRLVTPNPPSLTDQVTQHLWEQFRIKPDSPAIPAALLAIHAMRRTEPDAVTFMVNRVVLTAADVMTALRLQQFCQQQPTRPPKLRVLESSGG
jgi:hypothetical protein